MKVVQSVQIPVIANRGVNSVEDAENLFERNQGRWNDGWSGTSL